MPLKLLVLCRTYGPAFAPHEIVTRAAPLAASAIFAAYMPFCTASIQPTVPRADAQTRMAELWEEPRNVESRDMIYGPWGRAFAPNTQETFTFSRPKSHGVSPGFEVKDAEGREWSVKFGDEGHVEVFLSRILSALGYHQPPVYYVDAFALHDERGTHPRFPGARFRPKKVPDLKELGDWSWQRNPFVGTKPYQGLLVTLLLFNSSDLKNSNNSLFEYRGGGKKEARYVVRDLGTALGETGRLDPKRNDPDLFAKLRFIKRVDKDGFVEFSYHGWHQELYLERITADDVKWTCDWLARLTDRQWSDAFKSAGYDDETASKFLTTIKQRIDQGRTLRSEKFLLTTKPD
jgi:hypothetical protein